MTLEELSEAIDEYFDGLLNENPETIGAKIDHLKTVRESRILFDKKLEPIKELEGVLELDVIEVLDSQESTMGSGKKATGSITESEVAIVVDFDLFHEYIIESEAPYLLQRRAAQGAVKELLEAGEIVPGTKIITKRKLSLRKK